MLLKRFKRRPGFVRYYGRTLTRHQKRILRIVAVLIILMIVSLILLVRLQPVVTRMATARASNSVMLAINTAVYEKISDGNVTYNDLIMLEKDFNGHITALVTNMTKINTLQAQITERVIELLSEKRISELSIPVGNLIGGPLFSGRGFGIPVRIVSVSAVSSHFSNEFTSAGINQTRHRIILSVTVKINVLIPGSLSKAEINNEISVAETVIVGDVPGTYTYFEESSIYDSASEKYDILT